MLDKDLNKFKQNDIYSIVCELLYTLKGDEDYCALSELAFILDRESFIKFIKYFGGSTVKVPTIDEFKNTIKVIELYHYFNVQNYPWKEALVKAGFERNETRSAQRKLIAFTNVLSNIKAGRKYE